MSHWQTTDSPQRYGSISRILHWGMALVLLWQFVSVVLHFLYDNEQPLRAFFWSWHQPVGALLMLLVLLRGLWALANLRSRPPAGTTRFGRAATAGHVLLYAGMVLVPLLGLLRRYGSGRSFEPFGIPLFSGFDGRIGWMVEFGNRFHSVLGWILLALILGHVLVALLHRWLWKEDVLARIAGRGAPELAGPSRSEVSGRS